jgi:glucose-6-phosphate 1-dehydrogenase
MDACEKADVRLVIEKPFGYDLESARTLNAQLLEVFDESQIYRIDHYLGKETVQNLMALRFANALFEPVWNRNYIDSVEITAAEDIGIGTRAGYYEGAGALRDLVQNHMMQLLSLLAMEPPAAFEANRLRDEKLKVLEAIVPPDVDKVGAIAVRGQYIAGESGGEHVPGYRDEPGVAPDSRTETYAALRLEIENWRWAGVPFLIRTGKRLPVTETELRLVFKRPPKLQFISPGNRRPEPSQIVIRIGPETGIQLTVDAIRADKKGPSAIELEMEFAREGGEGPTPYEVLLHAALVGDSSHFTRQDNVEECWRIVQPLLDAPPPVHLYTQGSWGPEDAERLTAGFGGWRDPWSPGAPQPAMPQPTR